MQIADDDEYDGDWCSPHYLDQKQKQNVDDVDDIDDDERHLSRARCRR